MDFPYIVLVVIYFIFSLMNITSSGPHFAMKRKEEKKNCEWVTSQRPNNIYPEYISSDYVYYTLFTYALIPFHTLTKDNRFYIIRLMGYLTDFVYGGIGLIIWLFLYFIKNSTEALNSVFIKLKNL